MINKRNFVKILAVLLIILLSMFTLTGCGKNKEKNASSEESNYQEPLKNYFEGIKNRDVNQVLKAFPDFMDMASNISSEDIDDLYSQYEALYGANIKIDYTFGDPIELSEEELSELEEEISSVYQSAENIDITAGYSVPVKVTITGDGIEKSSEEKEEEAQEENNDNSLENANSNVEESDMYVLQYNGNWYIM